MAELRYNCNLLFNRQIGKEGQVRRLARDKNIPLTVAQIIIENLEKELQYTITINRLNQIRSLVNSSGIGVVQGAIGKRKYVRKVDIEVIDVEVVSPMAIVSPVVNLHGLIIPIDTIVSTSNNERGDYKIVSVIDTKTIKIQPVHISQGKTIIDYSLGQMNDYILAGMWSVKNPSEELLKKIRETTNVVKASDFKKDNCNTNDKYNQKANHNFVFSIGTINIGMTHIPITPGFTGNCQLSVIGYMSSLIAKSTNLVQQLREIRIAANRNLLLCDIQKKVLPDLESKIRKEAFNSKMEYTSSNGSNMIIVIIDLSKL